MNSSFVNASTSNKLDVCRSKRRTYIGKVDSAHSGMCFFESIMTQVPMSTVTAHQRNGNAGDKE